MKVIKTLNEIEATPFAATIGNFDGVHLGHREILSGIKEQCQVDGLSFVVITFVPHPTCILRPQDHFLINSYKERREMLETMGVDFLYEINFTRDFSTQKPEDFLATYLFSNPSLKKLFMGYDFAFGANKSGDFSLVKEYSKQQNVQVYRLDEYQKGEHKVSSTMVRDLVKAGEVQKAQQLLGRKFTLSGRVTKGEGRGRQLSFPTANLEYLIERLVPKSGVYVTEVRLRTGVFGSVTNIGYNPTFNNDQLTRVETHILDFNKDIYGEEIEIIFHQRLRDERKFSSVEALVKQIGEDVRSGREFFK